MITSNFLPLFDIKFINHTLVGKGSAAHVIYEVQIVEIFNNNKKWVIEKRYTEFYELNETLKVFVANRYSPSFPKKKLYMLEEKELAEREISLE